MQIATWNVNSIKARHEHLEAWLDRRRPDVVCLQELKSIEAKLPVALFTSRGYQLEALGQPTYNGVAIASLRPITDVERGLPEGDEGQARVISGVIDGVRVVCAYCPQGSEVESPKFAYKLRFFDALIPHIAARLACGPLILAGDINIAPLPDDVWDDVEMKDQVSYHPLEHERFRALEGLGLIDVVKPRLAPRTFTFWDYRELSFRRKRGMRIDHLLVTADVAARVTGAGVDIEERKKEKPSDHAPVWISLGE